MKKAIYFLFYLFSTGCTCTQNTESYPQFPVSPSHSPNEGFHWEIVSGAGLQCWTQQNQTVRLIPDDSLPGVRVVRNNDRQKSEVVIKILSLPDKDIASLSDTPQEIPELDTSVTYIFREIPSGRQGVKRYIPEPLETNTRSSNTQTPTKATPMYAPCYFEIHKNKPDKAIFIKTGRDTSLFDMQSIVLTNDTDPETKKDSLLTVQGTLRIGHEVRTFTADGDTTVYWIIDKTGKLIQAYENATGNGIKNGKPVHAVLKVKDMGKSNDGFAADYPSVYHIVEIIKINSK